MIAIFSSSIFLKKRYFLYISEMQILWEIKENSYYYYYYLLENGISDKSLIKFTIGIVLIKSIINGIIAIEILILKRIRSKNIL